jgi:hypothetical protein
MLATKARTHEGEWKTINLSGMNQPFDPAQGSPNGGKHGAWWIGDYQGLASTPGAFHPFWNDTRTGRLELFTATVRGG